MADFDYVILGAGAAGCVLANRLSEDPRTEVLLVEAGGHARSPYFHVPKIGAAMFGSDQHAWHYPIEPFGPNNGREVWPRGKVFKAIEDNQFGASPTRGAGGPLHVTAPRDPDPLCQDVIDAGATLGLRGMEDFNESDEERVGHAMATIYKGLRVSAAKAFLKPVLGRPNLHLAINTVAQRLVFENGRAQSAWKPARAATSLKCGRAK
jgi:choline dehydrogenase-like flavoprotein